jgi:protein TonB
MNMSNSPWQQWNDIVFENRNKDYGAYTIRKVYPRHIFLGAAAALLLFAIVLLIPIISGYFRHAHVPGIMDVPDNVSMALAPPPPIEKNIPAKLANPPSVKAMVQYVAPVVTTEQVVAPEIPAMEEVKVKETTAEKVEDKQEEGTVTTAVQGNGGEAGAVFDLAESMPHFIGGDVALGTYITNTIRYPATAQRMKLGGTVFVSFVVNEDGSISDVQTIKGFLADCDKEAERVIRSMPAWEPGRNNGKPVKVRLALPIKFRLGR